MEAKPRLADEAPGVGLHPTFDIRVLDDIFFIILAWKLRRSVMFIVRDQINHLNSVGVNRSFARSLCSRICIQVMPLLRSFDCLAAVQL